MGISKDDGDFLMQNAITTAQPLGVMDPGLSVVSTDCHDFRCFFYFAAKLAMINQILMYLDLCKEIVKPSWDDSLLFFGANPPQPVPLTRSFAAGCGSFATHPFAF